MAVPPLRCVGDCDCQLGPNLPRSWETERATHSDGFPDDEPSLQYAAPISRHGGAAARPPGPANIRTGAHPAAKLRRGHAAMPPSWTDQRAERRAAWTGQGESSKSRRR